MSTRSHTLVALSEGRRQARAALLPTSAEGRMCRALAYVASSITGGHVMVTSCLAQQHQQQRASSSSSSPITGTSSRAVVVFTLEAGSHALSTLVGHLRLLPRAGTFHIHCKQGKMYAHNSFLEDRSLSDQHTFSHSSLAGCSSERSRGACCGVVRGLGRAQTEAPTALIVVTCTQRS